MPQFPTGMYQLVTKEGQQLNRGPIEDLSLLPKPVYLLRPEMANSGMSRPLSLESKGNDSYTMRAGGSDVGNNQRDNNLGVALIPGLGVETGKVTFKEQSGDYKLLVDGRYVVKGEEGSFGHYVKTGSEGDAIVFRLIPLGQ